MAKKTLSISRIVLKLITFVPGILGLAYTVAAEAKLAGKSLFLFFVISFIVALLLMSSWLCLLALLFTYLISAQFSVMASLALVLLLNLILLTSVGLYTAKIKKDLLFPSTRRQVRSLIRN